jgi:hypothetical protein
VSCTVTLCGLTYSLGPPIPPSQSRSLKRHGLNSCQPTATCPHGRSQLISLASGSKTVKELTVDLMVGWTWRRNRLWVHGPKPTSIIYPNFKPFSALYCQKPSKCSSCFQMLPSSSSSYAAFFFFRRRPQDVRNDSTAGFFGRKTQIHSQPLGFGLPWTSSGVFAT